MSNASPYWIWVRVNAFGSSQRVEDSEAQMFFHAQLEALQSQSPLPHQKIQRQLHQWQLGSDPAMRGAQRCLRCFISNQIKQNCVDLEQRFGATHDFTHRDLLPLVLSSSPYPVAHPTETCLVDRVLATFDPSQSALSAWTARMFKSDRLVKEFLLEHGIEQITDWLILNRTHLGRLTQVLAQNQASAPEIEQATQLLQRYHQVYRAELLSQRHPQTKRRFPEPTDAQLEAIAAGLNLSATQVWQKLKYLAGIMRVARIQARGGAVPFSSRYPVPTVPLPPVDLTDVGESAEELEFLDRYDRHFQASLAEAIARVITLRLENYQTGKTAKAQQRAQEKQLLFLKALYLFHCRGVSMGEIATQLDLGDQPRVSRLLNLKTLRADIGRSMVKLLGDRVLDLAQAYVDPQRLTQVANQIYAILDQQVESTLAEAIREAGSNQRPAVASQLTQSICHYLQTQKGVL